MTNILQSEMFLKSIEQGILFLLLILGVACLAIFFWRWIQVNRTFSDARDWQLQLERELSESELVLEGSVGYGEKTNSPASRLVHTGFKNSALCPEAMERVLEIQKMREKKSLEKGALILGSVGANAPFLGLTGTVLGILVAFNNMAKDGGGGPEVMSAIAGALIATASGLMVAIPAVVLYNILKTKIRRALDGLEEIKGLLMARSFQASAKENF